MNQPGGTGTAEARSGADLLSRQVESSRVFFAAPESRAGRDRLRVVCAGYERCRPDYRIDRPGFPYACLEWVRSGAGELVIGGEAHGLRPGMFYLYGPELPHRIASAADEPLGKYFVAFEGRSVAGLLKALRLPLGQVGRSARPAAVRGMLEELVERGTRHSPLSADLCPALLHGLLMLCADDVASGQTRPGAEGEGGAASFRRVRAYLEQHPLAHRSVRSAAAACGMSAEHMSRLFARHHGTGAYAFLVRLRMQHAASLLLERQSGVAEVAALLGYRDAGHFSRVFRSVHRVPPSRFRRRGLARWQT